MIHRLALALTFSLWASLAVAQGYINPPVYATGYINVVGQTTANTTIPNARNPPTNLNIFATGNITTWNVTMPSPAFDGQIISIGCPGGSVTTLNTFAGLGDTIQSSTFNSCVAGTGQFVQFEYSQPTTRWILLTNTQATGSSPPIIIAAGANIAVTGTCNSATGINCTITNTAPDNGGVTVGAPITGSCGAGFNLANSGGVVTCQPNATGSGTMTSATINAGANVTTSGTCSDTVSINCTINASAGGAGTVTSFTTHAALIAGTTAFSTETLYQAGFYAAGDSGSATYNWNATSTCSTAVTTSGDGVTCIKPSAQSVGTPGRYILVQPTGGIDVRAIGMQPSFTGNLIDNAPLIPTLMNAIGTAAFNGGYEVLFGGIAGQTYTAYYFSTSLILSRNATYRCSGGTGGSAGVELAFAPGVHGAIQESFQFTDGGEGGGKLEGCDLVTTSLGTLTAAAPGATTLTGGPLLAQDSSGQIPRSTWTNGDGIILAPSSPSVYFPYVSLPAIAPGAYITCAGACGSSIALASPYATAPVGPGFATATFAQTGTNNFLAGDTLLVGNNTFTFVSSIGAAPGNVLIGANWTATANNLIDCINNHTTNSDCVAPTNTPNISAQLFIYNNGLNHLVFTALSIGTGGNALPSVYTPAGTAAGAFVIMNSNSGGTLFSFGSASSSLLMAAWQLPVADKFSVTTTSGSSTITITAGPRLLRPAEPIWADFAPFGTLILSAQASSLFTETSTNNFGAGDTLQVGNNTFTFVAGSPSTGQVQVGVDFTTTANSLASAITTNASGATWGKPTSTPNVGATVGTGTINFTANSTTPTSASAVSIYTPAGTSAGSFQAGTFTYQTVTMANAFFTAGTGFALAQNATVTHTAGSGQFWIMPEALKRDVAAKSSHNKIWGWPVGRGMNCASGAGLDCTGSYDEANTYQQDLIAIWLGGNNTSLSSTKDEFTAKNYMLGYMNGGTLGLADFNYGGEDSEDTPGSQYEIVGNCSTTNASSLFGGYIVGGGQGCANPVGFFPVTSGSPWVWFGPQNAAPAGVTSIGHGIAIGNWRYFSGPANAYCIDLGNTINTLRFASNCNSETATAWSWTWNSTANFWQILQGSTPSFGFVSSAAALGYTGYAGSPAAPYTQAPGGELFYNTEGVGLAINGARLLSMGPTIPTGIWHAQGDAQFDTTPAVGGNALWIQTPIATATLSAPVTVGLATVAISACPTISPAAGSPIDDTTAAPNVLIGLFGSCSTGTLSFQTTASGAAASGHTISFLQQLSAGIIQGGTPVLSSCGTSPSVATGSNNIGGQFTMGTATPTACTITFAQPYPAHAFCTVTPASSGGAAITGGDYISTQSAAAFTWTLGTGTNSLVFNYTCAGN